MSSRSERWPAGDWSVLLTRLNSMGDHAVAARRTALALVGLLTVVLGWWGFSRYSGQHPEASLGWSEWTYGTLNLFINGADVAPVPWQLDVADVGTAGDLRFVGGGSVGGLRATDSLLGGLQGIGPRAHGGPRRTGASLPAAPY